MKKNIQKIYLITSIITLTLLIYFLFEEKRMNARLLEKNVKLQEQLIIDSIFFSSNPQKFLSLETSNIPIRYKKYINYVNQFDSSYKNHLYKIQLLENRFKYANQELNYKNYYSSNLEQTNFLLDSQIKQLVEEKNYFNKLNLLMQDGLNDASKLIDSLNESKNKIEFVNAKGVKIIYFGSTDKNMANGYGIAYYSTGSFYVGEWKNNKRSGIGEYRWLNGDMYFGDFKNDQRHGEGRYVFNSGEKYEGEWRNDLRDGKGILFSKDGSIVLNGIWERDKFLVNLTSNDE